MKKKKKLVTKRGMAVRWTSENWSTFSVLITRVIINWKKKIGRARLDLLYNTGFAYAGLVDLSSPAYCCYPPCFGHVMRNHHVNGGLFFWWPFFQLWIEAQLQSFFILRRRTMNNQRRFIRRKICIGHVHLMMVELKCCLTPRVNCDCWTLTKTGFVTWQRWIKKNY